MNCRTFPLVQVSVSMLLHQRDERITRKPTKKYILALEGKPAAWPDEHEKGWKAIRLFRRGPLDGGHHTERNLEKKYKENRRKKSNANNTIWDHQHSRPRTVEPGGRVSVDGAGSASTARDFLTASAWLTMRSSTDGGIVHCVSGLWAVGSCARLEQKIRKLRKGCSAGAEYGFALCLSA